MKVFLTGATGFIGSHIARRLLAEGHDVRALVRDGSSLSRLEGIVEELELVRGDIRHRESFEGSLRDIDACVHAAWYAEPGKYLTSVENFHLVGATIELALSLARAGCPRLTGVGTCYEYDTSLGRLAEDSPTGPASPYAAAKLATATALIAVPGVQTAWARLFWQYGPYEDPRRLVPAVVLALLRGDRAPTTRGEQVRDFLHVEDVAAAICAVALSDVTGTVNIGSGEPVSVRQVVETIAEIIGRPELLDLGARQAPEGEPMRVWADNAKLSALGWSPTHSMSEGLTKTVQWWRARL